MATVLENRTSILTEEEEKRIHDAQIKERYEKLLHAEENQLNESVYGERNEMRASSTLAPERPYSKPIAPETPVTSEPSFTHTRVDSPLFTTQTLDKTLVHEEALPLAGKPEIGEMAMSAPAIVELPVAAEKVRLSPFAMAAAAAVGVLVIIMMSIIGINSRAIRLKNVRIKQMEEKKTELTDSNAAYAAEIESATSPETIQAWAEAHGWTKD